MASNVALRPDPNGLGLYGRTPSLHKLGLRSPQLPPLSILRRFKAGPCGYKCPLSGCRHTRLPKRSTRSQPAFSSWRSWLSTSRGTVSGLALGSCPPSSSLGVRLPSLMLLIIHLDTQADMQHASGAPPRRF